MINALSKHRELIIASLHAIATEHASKLESVAEWGADLHERVFEFAARGKHIRGSLVAAGVELFGRKPDQFAYTTAASLELVQSFLLIHDDIMDEDTLRRGRPAVHEQYRKLGEARGVRDPQRFGESLGVCAGDVAVMLAIEAITASDGDPRLIQRLVRALSHEIASVGVAQMADVANGHEKGAAPTSDHRDGSEAAILAVYRHKTGRYTFSLPLVLGATIAGARESDIDRLSAWGEIQGVIFQIRDDHLDIYGNEEKTGKPGGTDIASDKQTLHRRKLLDRIAGRERDEFLALCGRQGISHEGLTRVRSLLESTGVNADIQELVTDLAAQADSIAGQLETVTRGGRRFLDDLSRYNQHREA